MAGAEDPVDETFREFERVVDPEYLDDIRAQAKEFSTKPLTRQARLAARAQSQSSKIEQTRSGLILFER